MGPTDTPPAFAEDVSDETLQQHVAAGEKTFGPYMQMVRAALASIGMNEVVSPETVDALAVIASERANDFRTPIKKKRDILLTAHLARALLQTRLAAKDVPVRKEEPSVVARPADPKPVTAPAEPDEAAAKPVDPASNGKWVPRPPQRRVQLPDPPDRRKKVEKVEEIVEPDVDTIEAEAAGDLASLNESAPLGRAEAQYVKGLSASAPLSKDVDDGKKQPDLPPPVRSAPVKRVTRKKAERDQIKRSAASAGDDKPAWKKIPGIDILMLMGDRGSDPAFGIAGDSERIPSSPKKNKQKDRYGPAELKAKHTCPERYAEAMVDAEKAHVQLADLIKKSASLKNLLTFAIEMTDEEKKNYKGVKQEHKALLDEMDTVLRTVREARIRRGWKREDEDANEKISIYRKMWIVLADFVDQDNMRTLKPDELSKDAKELQHLWGDVEDDVRDVLILLLSRIGRGEQELAQMLDNIEKKEDRVLRNMLPDYDHFHGYVKVAGRDALHDAVHSYSLNSGPYGEYLDAIVGTNVDDAQRKLKR